MEKSREEQEKIEITRYGYLPRPLQVLLLVAAASVLGLAFYFLFGLGMYAWRLLSFPYYWLIIGIVTFSCFLIQPGRQKDKMVLPWYDLAAGILGLTICLYFCSKSWVMLTEGWYHPALGIVLALLILEGARRVVGPIFAGICAIGLVYPLFAGHMPGVLWGQSLPLDHLMRAILFTQEGMLGILTSVATEILIGFFFFAALLIASGAGDFFLNLALALLGKARGGAAKVAVLASGFFASLSGSATANVVATGSFTIPAMKRTGLPAHFAGAVEACASTGGALMPPVMGANAFIMCQLTGIPYGTIIIAAAIPAILYYFAAFMQIDLFSAATGLKGLPAKEIPSLKKTLKEGWLILFILAFLVWGLVYMRWERLAPWFAVGALVVLSSFMKNTRLNPKKLVICLVTVGRLVTQVGMILFAMNLLYGGLTITGLSGSFAAGLTNLGGGNIILIVLMGVLGCFIFGLAGMHIPAYIFMALTWVPVVISLGNFNILSSHLFIIYAAELSQVTPPVAIAAFLAGSMAQADPMRTAWQAMRLSIVLYFIPVFFLIEPALILQGKRLLHLLYLLPMCLTGVSLIAAGLQGYMWKIGKLKLWACPAFIISGFLIGFPEWKCNIIGAALALLTLIIIQLRKRLTSET